MKCIEVELYEKSYPIVISNKFDKIKDFINNKNNQCVIVIDSNVAKLYLDSLSATLQNVFNNVHFYIIGAGEENKSLETTEQLYSFLIEQKMSRNDTIIAFGGGMTGDLGGFVAATYMRGINYIQIPTTFLAQADSSIGGKTAVNMNKIKNIIGAFYQPSLVYVNYSVLKTLSIKEIKNGLIEILVHAIIKDAELFDYIEQNLEKIYVLEESILEKIIYWSCKIKKEVVERDEKEVGERAILNFGHTYGHAIEGSYEYRYRHGECVAIGIIGACYIAEDQGFLDKATTERIRKLLIRMHVLPVISDCNKRKVLDLLKHDKKKSENKIYFILPLKIGNVIKCKIENFEVIESTLERLIDEKWQDNNTV